MKQRVPTTKKGNGYEGTYCDVSFTVEKDLNGTWYGEGSVVGIEAEGQMKREVVNTLADQIDEYKEETKTYEDDIFEGNAVYSVKMVKERDYGFHERTNIGTPDDIGRFLTPYFETKDREAVVVLFLDSGNTVTGLHELSVGGLSASVVDVRNVFKAALLANAASIVMAHNHPSGNPEPSSQDVRITKKVKEAGEVMDIPLHDHVIWAEETTTSLRGRGLI